MVLGLGNASRALRMISLAQRYNPPDQISFAGIDRFDSRPVDAVAVFAERRPSAAASHRVAHQPHSRRPARGIGPGGDGFVRHRFAGGLGRSGCPIAGAGLVLRAANAQRPRRWCCRKWPPTKAGPLNHLAGSIWNGFPRPPPRAAGPLKQPSDDFRVSTGQANANFGLSTRQFPPPCPVGMIESPGQQEARG